jgi:hypothetical protein
MSVCGRKLTIRLRANEGPNRTWAQEGRQIPSCICAASANMGRYRTVILSLMRLRVRTLPLEGV